MIRMAYCKFCNSPLKTKDKRRKFCDYVCRKAYYYQNQHTKHKIEKALNSYIKER